MRNKARSAWRTFWASFHGSELIVWARLQVVAAAVWVALQSVDISPLIKDPKWLMYWIIGSNVINELLRRHRAEYGDDGKMK